jgi:hypothetical protein
MQPTLHLERVGVRARPGERLTSFSLEGFARGNARGSALVTAQPPRNGEQHDQFQHAGNDDEDKRIGVGQIKRERTPGGARSADVEISVSLSTVSGTMGW